MTYFSIFDDHRVESHADRIWGMIEKVQGMFLKLMGRTSQDQSLHNSSNCHFTRREWELLKSRFSQESMCFFKYTGFATARQYGPSLSQVTIKKKGVEKEVIVVANNAMFVQLIQAFGTCVASSVRKRFPTGDPRFGKGENVTFSRRSLKTNHVLNSLLILRNINVPNSDVQYKYRQTARGVDVCYNPFLKKITVYVRYQNLKAIDPHASLFYSNYNVERAVETRILVRVDSEFEAFNCLFLVVSVCPDNDEVSCRVVEEYGDNDNTYHVNSIHVFTTLFVSTKIREYLTYILIIILG